jgi:hypothetical protein
MDRLPVGQHSPHLWREHMHQMSRMGSMPTTQDYMPSVQIPDYAQSPLTVIVKNNTTSTIEAGMTHRASCYVPAAPDNNTGELRISPSGGIATIGGTPVTAVDDVPAGGMGEFYCAGIYPARISITSTDSAYRYAWWDQDNEGEIKTSLLGDFYTWPNRWIVEVDGEDDEDWCMVERVPSLSTNASGHVYPQPCQWSGVVKLTSGTLGGDYEWTLAAHAIGGSWTAPANTFSSANTATAKNLAEVYTTGYQSSVPNASIPAGWAALPIVGYVNMTVTFYQGDYRAWFCVQNQFSGACS